MTDTAEFYEDLKGYKVQVVCGPQARETYIGLIAEVIGGEWLKLVPFEATKVTEKYEQINADIEIVTIHSTVYKKIKDITTFVILDKPDKTYEQSNSEDTESEQESGQAGIK